MAVLLSGRSGSYLQLVTVLLIFVLVLAVTAWVTKWIASYQKQQSVNCNVEVVETTRIGNNKYIQILRVGETYMAVAVCKDNVTMLGEVPKEQLTFTDGKSGNTTFTDLFAKAMIKKNSSDSPDTEKEPEDKDE